MAGRITIKDIAKELNIHHSTVSRALRNDVRVKEETRNLIREYALKHGYKVNMNALQLRGTVRNIIAVIVPNVSHSFFSNVVGYIANQAKADGYIVSVFQSNESVEEEKELINTLIQNNVAGVMASVSLETQDGTHYNELKRFGIPLVFFDRILSDVSAPKVLVNNAEAVAQSVDVLVKRGYQRIAHITGTHLMNVFHERQKGYRSAIQKHHLNYQQAVEIPKAFNIEDGEDAIDQLFETKIHPDALIIDSYNLTLGVYAALKKRNLKIPDDVAIIGFGDHPSVEVIQPALSTIVQPEEDMARAGYQLLKEQIDTEGKVAAKKIEVASSFILRESC